MLGDSMKKSFRIIGIILALMFVFTYVPEVEIISSEIIAFAESINDNSSQAENEQEETEIPAGEVAPNFSYPDKL